MQKILIRKATKEELEWINSKYSQIGFVHSNFEKEIIAVAEYEGPTMRTWENRNY